MNDPEREALIYYLKRSSNALNKQAVSLIESLLEENEVLKQKPTSVKEIRLKIEEMVKHIEANGGVVSVGQNILGETVVSIVKKVSA